MQSKLYIVHGFKQSYNGTIVHIIIQDANAPLLRRVHVVSGCSNRGIRTWNGCVLTAKWPCSGGLETRPRDLVL